MILFLVRVTSSSYCPGSRSSSSPSLTRSSAIASAMEVKSALASGLGFSRHVAAESGMVTPVTSNDTNNDLLDFMIFLKIG